MLSLNQSVADKFNSSSSIVLARRGADDPAGHDRGGKRGGVGRGGRDGGPNNT